MTLNPSVTWTDFSPSAWKRGRSSSGGRGGGRGGRHAPDFGLSRDSVPRRDSDVVPCRRRRGVDRRGLSRDVAIRRLDSADRRRVDVRDRAPAVGVPRSWRRGSDARYPAAVPGLPSFSRLTGCRGDETRRLA